MKLFRLFALCSVLTFPTQFAHANLLHLYLESKDVDLRMFADTVSGLKDPLEYLNEIDGEGYTVLGRAILHGHQAIVQLLLRWGCRDVGPRYRHLTLTRFAFQVSQFPVHVFLTYYEHDTLNGYTVDQAIARALLEQRDYNLREAQIRANLLPLPPIERQLDVGGYLAGSVFPNG